MSFIQLQSVLYAQGNRLALYAEDQTLLLNGPSAVVLQYIHLLEEIDIRQDENKADNVFLDVVEWRGLEYSTVPDTFPYKYDLEYKIHGEWI